MELREPIEDINKKLLFDFGELNNQARFRVVFSDDIFEKRWTEYTDEGFKLLEPEIRELPKYRQYVRGKYILERLIPVPENVETDIVTKVSYEPLWVFQDKNQQYLPPFYDGCRFIIDAMEQNIRQGGVFKKYKDESETPESRKAEIDKMQKELFGNETDIGDALAYSSGVGFTTNKLLQ